MFWKRKKSADHQVKRKTSVSGTAVKKTGGSEYPFYNREEREENREWKQQDQIICIKNWEFQKRYTTSGRR